jgi:hypothetical protein
MPHPLVLALYSDPAAAAAAARDLRALGVPRERVSIIARSHDEEVVVSRQSGASPGSEIEDSRPASRLGELSAHLIAAVALVMPGIGPIVADGPLAAELGEAAGHLAGGLHPALERAGLDHNTAEDWTEHIRTGAVLVGAHLDTTSVDAARSVAARHRATHTEVGIWSD